MAIPVYNRPAGYRYLGNTNTTEVHDLHSEKGKCQIDEIITARHAVVFSPDTDDQAHRERYDNCHWCIGGSTR